MVLERAWPSQHGGEHEVVEDGDGIDKALVVPSDVTGFELIRVFLKEANEHKKTRYYIFH